MSPRLIVALAIAAIAAATLYFDASGALAGKIPQLGRSVVAIVGLIAALLIGLGNNVGWVVAMVWAIVQIPVFAWTVDGSPNVQALSFPFGFTHSAKVNDQVTSYSEIGINVAALIFLWAIRHYNPTSRKL